MSSVVPVVDTPYSKPMFSHDEVVKDPALFWDSLRSLHSEMGTKYMVPTIGGIELDFHAVYIEVTKRGGYDKVVLERKWSEISSLFGFSPTNASHTLKKYYYSFLYSYEQLYFFKLHGSTLTPRAPLTFVTGMIDAKTDNGYLVSVKMGTETWCGEIFHRDNPNPSESAKSSSAVVSYDPDDTCTRERKRKRKEDRDRPKPTRSGYNFYFADKYRELKGACPDKETEFAKMIGESWRSLGLNEKNEYNEIGMKDKERYQKELREYKGKMKDQGEADKKPAQ